MKKKVLFMGMALAALASCTNDEVVDIAANRAIQFSSFVNGNTRGVTEIPNQSEWGAENFYVFGNYGGSGESTYDKQAFKNELGTTLYYWTANSKYRFAAYADGAGGRIENATFDASTPKLSFPSYTPDDGKDLVAAVTDDVTTQADVTNPNSVSLSFKHMLAQVAFEFKTDAAEIYDLQIADLKINNAIHTADGSISGTTPTISWAKTNNAEQSAYTYDEFNNKDLTAQTGKTFSQSKLVIPQDLPTTEGTDKITVTFTAKLHNENDGDNTTNDKSRNFTCDLTFENNKSSSLDANKWTAGYRYKYTATINPDNIEENLKPIKFTATVEQWKDANSGQGINPTEQTQP